MEERSPRGLLPNFLLLLVCLTGLSEGLQMRVLTPSRPDEHDVTRSSFFLLAGQSFEVECWPDDYEIPNGGLKNFSIQLSKSKIPYTPRPMWTEDAMLTLDDSNSKLISGNDQIEPTLKERVGNRYEVVRKEHTFDNGVKVPKFVLSVRDAKPEDTGKMDCTLLEYVVDPHHDPNDMEKRSNDVWGPAIKVLGDLTKLEMFHYEYNSQYNYDILAKDTLYNSQDLVVNVGDTPHIACRVFFPSYYPTVRFLLKDAHGIFEEDVTNHFHRYHDFKKQQISWHGPLVKMEFMQDYINEYKEGYQYDNFIVNATHNNKQLWCVAQVVGPEGESLQEHGHYVNIRVNGVEDEHVKYQEEDESKHSNVHLPREDVKSNPEGGNVIQSDDSAQAEKEIEQGEEKETAKSNPQAVSSQNTNNVPSVKSSKTIICLLMVAFLCRLL